MVNDGHIVSGATSEEGLLTTHGLADGGAQLILAVPKVTQLQHWSL